LLRATTAMTRGKVLVPGLIGTVCQLGWFSLLPALTLLVAVLIWRVVTSPALELIGLETNIVFWIERLALTGRLYTDPQSLPFVVVPYGTLFIYLASGIHRGLHLGGSVDAFYLAARLSACLSMLLTVAGIGATLVRHLRVPLVPAAITSLLSGLAIFPWAYVARADAMYLALLVWAVFTFYFFVSAPSAWRLIIPLGLLLCGFYVKQTALMFLPLLAIGGLLLLPSMAQRLVFLLIGAAMIAFAILIAPSEFWQNSTIGLANGISPGFALKIVYWPFLYTQGMILAAWIPCLLLAIQGWKRERLLLGVMGTYALAVGTVTALKFGADTNYFDEYLIFAMMLIAASLADLRVVWNGPRGTAQCFAVALIWSYVLQVFHTQVIPIHRAYFDLDRPSLVAVSQYFSDRPGELVMDLAAHGIGTFLPTRVAFAPFDIYGASAFSGHFDVTPVRNAIASGSICYAVTRLSWASGDVEQSPFLPWTSTILRDLLPLFRRDAQFGKLVVMRNPVCLGSEKSPAGN
jgi:hypothetical protein